MATVIGDVAGDCREIAHVVSRSGVTAHADEAVCRVSAFAIFKSDNRGERTAIVPFEPHRLGAAVGQKTSRLRTGEVPVRARLDGGSRIRHITGGEFPRRSELPPAEGLVHGGFAAIGVEGIAAL